MTLADAKAGQGVSCFTLAPRHSIVRCVKRPAYTICEIASNLDRFKAYKVKKK